MKIQNVVKIDGNVVNKVFHKADLSVYKYDICDDEVVLYFVKNETIIFKQAIRADCNHGYGFISEINFEVV